jgi:hypothetical protein
MKPFHLFVRALRVGRARSPLRAAGVVGRTLQRSGAHGVARPTLAIAALLLAAFISSSSASTIDSANRYAFGANVGWLDCLANTNHGVVIGPQVCSGYIFSGTLGWISVGNGAPTNSVQYQNLSADDFGVNVDGSGNLRGYAFNANIGWINFETNGDAKVDLVTGKLSGYAFSPTCGWINLSNEVAYVQTHNEVVIVGPPQNQTVAVGQNATFTVGAIGLPPLSYQWQLASVPIADATNSNYVKASAQCSEVGNSYDVVVTNSFGAVTSSVATLSVVALASITDQPTNQAANVGQTVTFVVGAINSCGDIAYQWRKNGSAIANATASSYQIASAQCSSAGTYDVLVTNIAGTVTSSAATLAVTALPTISSHPANQTVTVGQSATFNVNASAACGAFGYQWQFNGANIPNATTTSYTRANSQPANAGSYSVVLSNSAAVVNSSVATLTVNEPEIVVEQPTGTNLVDGAATVNLGSGYIFNQFTRTFTIRNTGPGNLTGLGITIDGTNASDFSVIASPVAPVSQNATTTFTVRFTPSADGLRTAALHIASNDTDESSFDITLTGTGIGIGEFSVYGGSGHPLGGCAYFGIDGMTTIVPPASKAKTWYIEDPPVGTFGATYSAFSAPGQLFSFVDVFDNRDRFSTYCGQNEGQARFNLTNVVFTGPSGMTYVSNVTFSADITAVKVQLGDYGISGTLLPGTITGSNTANGQVLYRITSSPGIFALNTPTSIEVVLNTYSLAHSVGANPHYSRAQVQLQIPPGPIFALPPGYNVNGGGITNNVFAGPIITNMVPPYGLAGNAVKIQGAGFTGASSVTFNETNASFTVNSESQITATVPAGATTGRITVTTPNGIGRSIAEFFVGPASETVFTIAGSNGLGFSGDGGLATSALIYYPNSSAIGLDGSVYFFDAGNARVRRIDPVTRNITTIAGSGAYGTGGDGGAATNAELAEVASIALDSAREVLYLVERDNNRVRRVNLTNGIISAFAGDGFYGSQGNGGAATAARFASPQGITVARNGDVYIADTSNGRIRRVDILTGNIQSFAGSGSIFSPCGPVVPANNVSASSACINKPADIAFDGKTNLFLLCQSSGSISAHVRRINKSNGRIFTVAGGGASAPTSGLATNALLDSPRSIAVNEAGTLLFIANGNRLLKVDLVTGQISVFGGNVGEAFYGDGGPPINALFASPDGLSMTPAGEIIVCDAGNNRVRYILPASIAILANNALAGLFLPFVTSLIGDLIIQNSSSLNNIDAGDVISVAGNIDISGNGSAVNVDLSNLGTAGNVSITGNGSATNVDLGNLGTVGNLSIIGNGSATDVDLGNLGTVGNVSITGNGSAANVDLSNLGFVGDDLTVANNGTNTMVSLDSLTNVMGDFTIETHGQTTVNFSGVSVGGDTSIEAHDATMVSAITAPGSTDVSLINGAAIMTVELTSGTFASPVNFSVQSLSGAAVNEQPGTLDGNAVMADPVSAYQFNFATLALNQPAGLTFDIYLPGLGTNEQALLISAADAGRLTLAVKSDASGSEYQLFDVCGANPPVLNSCARLLKLDTNGVALPEGSPIVATTLRLEGVVGHFSTYAAVTFEPIINTNAPPTNTLGFFTIAGGILRFSFLTETGKAYTVQYSDSLSPANWLPLTNYNGDGSVWRVSDPLPPPTPPFRQRYYRMLTQ